MSGQRVGYIRVSTLDQTTDRQLDGLALDRTFTDKASGKDVARPQLKAMLGFVRDGDTVIAHSMDRLARNLDDLRSLVATLTGRGVRVEFVKEQLTFTGEDSPMANLLLSVMGAFAEFERALIRERQREGIALAKTRGVYTGRRPALTPEQADELRARVAAGQRKASVARDYGISRQTVYQYLHPTTDSPPGGVAPTPAPPAAGATNVPPAPELVPQQEPERVPDELEPAEPTADAPPADAPPAAAPKRRRKTTRPWLAVTHDPREDPTSPKAIVIASYTTQAKGMTGVAQLRARSQDPDAAYSLINENAADPPQPVTDDHPRNTTPKKPPNPAPEREGPHMNAETRLVTVLLTLAVPDAADAGDAATLVALAAQTTALDVVHATAVEGHLPLPGTTVLRGRQPRPWLVKAINDRTAMVADLAGGIVEVSLRTLAPDPITTQEPEDPAP